jgi:phage gpG-like protein
VIDVRAKVDLRDVQRGIDALANPRAVAKGLRELKKPLREDQRDHARKSEGPDGRWPARQARSRRRLLGRLPQAVRAFADRNSVSVVSKVRWSAIHQLGGRGGHGARLPARPFLWVSDGLHTKAAEVLRDAVAEAW